MNAKSQTAFDSMKLACEIHSPESLTLVQNLCEKFPKVVKHDNEFLLRWACFHGNLDIVKFLSNIGGNIQILDNECLKWAAENGHLYTVKYLISQGANIHSDNNLALRSACRKKHLDVVQLLVSYGANIHTNNDECLRVACSNGQLDMVNFLVEKGANVSAENNQPIRNAFYHYERPVNYSKHYEHTKDNKRYFEHSEVIDFLIGKGARIPTRLDHFEVLRECYLCPEMVAKLETLRNVTY